LLRGAFFFALKAVSASFESEAALDSLLDRASYPKTA